METMTPSINTIDLGIKENKKDEVSLVFAKELTCPVCRKVFSLSVAKNRFAKIKKKDTDFYIEYEKINPYFYDIWLCPECGYATLKKDFENIKKNYIELIEQNISKRWVARKYPDTYDVDIAIERYKMALLNYYIMKAKDSQQGYVCLKLSWMYRLKGDIENEKCFQQRALNSLTNAYSKEDFPFYGMDKPTVQYLIGELNRRLGKTDEAMRWFGEVIVSREANSIIKEKAKDQREEIKRTKISQASE